MRREQVLMFVAGIKLDKLRFVSDFGRLVKLGYSRLAVRYGSLNKRLISNASPR
jgi:hypothetical protein